MGVDHITGVDISEEMTDKAYEKDVYEKLQNFDLSLAEDWDYTLNNKFDYVVCAGLVNGHHMDYNLFEEMTLGVKQGGYIIFSASYSGIGTYWDHEIRKEMLQESRWKFVGDKIFHTFGGCKTGIGRFGSSPMKVYCF